MAEELVETVAVQDVYADGIATVELVSDVNVRITYFSNMHVEGRPPVRVVCARIIRPRASLVVGQVTAMLDENVAPKTND